MSPHDELAEQCVLGAMLLNPGAIADVSGQISAEHYYEPKHNLIHHAITDLYAAGGAVDAVTVGAELESRGQLKKVGGPAYLIDLIQVVPMAGNAMNYARMVAEKWRLRRMAEFGVRLQQLAHTEGHDSTELIAQAQRYFRDVDTTDSTAASFDQLVALWRDWQTEPDTYVKTPWPEVNYWLQGGLAKGRLVTIGGRPSVGKSLGGLNIAAYAAEQQHPTIFFSLEMSKAEVASRVLACGGSADLGQIVRKRLDLENLARVDEYAHTYSGMPLLVDDREKITVEQIAAKCRTIPRLAVAVVDYLQLVAPSDSKVSREQQVSHISRSLKLMARELDIAVVVAAQLNRGPVKDGKPRLPTIADLRESGAIEQDSDQVILLHKDDDDPNIIRMICGKNRSGKTGEADLAFHGNYARIASDESLNL